MDYQRKLIQQLQQLGDMRMVAQSVSLSAIYYPLAIVPEDSGPTETAPHLTIADLLRPDHAGCVVIGAAAAGKSTLLQWVALAAAAAVVGEPEEAAEFLSEPAEALVPLLIDLGRLAHELAPDAMVAAALEARGLGMYLPLVVEACERGTALLLFDGIEPDNAASAYTTIDRFRQRYATCRLLAAQRSDVDGVRLDGLHTYRLLPLDRKQIPLLFARWYGVLVPGAPDIERLQGEIIRHDILRELAASPLAAALCAVAAAAGESLAVVRGSLGRRMAEVLLGRSSREDRDLLLQAAQRLAFAIPADQPVLTSHAMAQRASDSGITDPAGTLQQLLRAGILLAAGRGRLRFASRALHTCLAAGALANLPDFALAEQILRPDEQHHETIILAAAARMTANDDNGWLAGMIRSAEYRPASRGGRRQVPQEILDTWRDLVIAARVLLATPAAEQQRPIEVAAIRTQLLAMIGTPDCPVAQRVQAGRLLGELGDPRFEALLPPLATIDGGSFVLGADLPGYEEEGPAQRIDIPTFQIGIYPVTNREYARFLDDRAGQNMPHYWHDPRLNNPSLPVVGVTWHDANAYCAWLTERLAAAGLLPEGMVVRLPLEAEWEKAAIWGPRVKRKPAYPWGDRWDAARANTAEGRTAEGRSEWMTTPVGCFPAGVGNYGVHDMIGNVWEWTASIYTSYPGATLAVHQPGNYVLRGSSYTSNSGNTRATYRSSHLPAGYWYYHLGFRVVIGRPLTAESQ
ncbi:MAG TPA: SUMF1/EgtB/PvdO family nonheme iron enzyme [Roseiflexaceae bacterium]|nr:SUMF1/EgtB/PvdO family nonheme iron enzyme [Roseiflexaceae bacterium]